MEKDFIGIHSKILHPDAAKDAGPSLLQWPFSNKASAMQQFMLYKSSQEERPRNHHALPQHPSLRSQPLLITSPSPALTPQNPHFKPQNPPRNSAASSSSQFPFVGSFGHRNKAKKNHRSTAQLTVFYGGCVNVFDDVPSDKARSIMSSLANRGPNEASARRAIPQARKASLARFLEKRKERLTSAMPYSSTKISSENDSVIVV